MRLMQIRRTEPRESDPCKSLLRTKKRPLREEWKGSGDNKKSLIWLPMKTRTKMRSKCTKNSWSTGYTPRS